MLHHLEKLMDLYFAYLPRPRPQITLNTRVCLVAHRGAHDDTRSIRENTHAAFKRALDVGCYGIELDVHACADAVLVVNHDATLKRLWGHDVAIDTLSFSELRAMVPSIPSLAEVVVNYGKRMHLFIELKSPFLAFRALADTLQTLTPSEDYHLISLDEKIFPLLTLFPKHALLLVPIHNNISQFCKLSLQENYAGVLGHYFLLSNKQIHQLQAVNQLVGVGFIDSKFSLYRELNRGVFFLFSNNAADVAACIQELRHLK